MPVLLPILVPVLVGRAGAAPCSRQGKDKHFTHFAPFLDPESCHFFMSVPYAGILSRV